MTTARTFNEANFEAEVTSSSQPVLVDFYADWCGPCRTIGPIVEELAAEFEPNVRVGKVDVDANQELAARFAVASIPTLLILQDGKEVDRITGLAPKAAIADRLQGLLSTP